MYYLQSRITAENYFLKKKPKQGCRNDRRHCILKTASTHQFKATDVKHEILYMT